MRFFGSGSGNNDGTINQHRFEIPGVRNDQISRTPDTLTANRDGFFCRFQLASGTPDDGTYRSGSGNAFVRMTYDSKLGVGTTTPSEVLTVSGNIDLKNSSGFAKIDNSGSLSMADDATVTLSSSRNGSALILVYEVGSGIGALFYTCFGLAVTKLAGTSLTANSDSDGDLCCYNSGHTITVKNRLGATKTVVITVLGGNVY